MLPELNKSILKEFSKAQEELPADNFTIEIVNQLPASRFKVFVLLRSLIFFGIAYLSIPLVSGLLAYLNSNASYLLASFGQEYGNSFQDIFVAGVTMGLALVYFAWLKFKPS